MCAWLHRNLTSIVVIGNGLLLTTVCICWALISEKFGYELANDEMPTGLYLQIHFAFCLVMGVTGFFLLKVGKPNRRITSLIFGFAIIFRIILIPSTPIHESDFYRYQWDGKVASAGINPFLFEPGALRIWEENLWIEFADADTGVTWRGRRFSDEEIATLKKLGDLRDENPELFKRVSHPAVTTIYPPVAQAVFWTSSRLFGDSLAGLKAMIVLFDIGTMVVVLGILSLLGKNTFGLIFYAWNPLVLKEFSNSAHYDSVPIFFTVLTVYLSLRQPSKILPAISLAAGTLAKYFSVLLLPILLFQRRSSEFQSWLRGICSSALFLIVATLGFIPFLTWNEAGMENVFRGLSTYNAHWEYNAGVFALLSSWFGFLTAKKIVAGLLMAFIALLAVYPVKNRNHLVWKCFAVIGALFILSPTAFPWYFAWVLPFLCVFPRVSWLLLGALLPINYLDFHSTESVPFAHGSWGGIFYTSWICWGTLLIAWMVEFIVSRSNRVGSANQPC